MPFAHRYGMIALVPSVAQGMEIPLHKSGIALQKTQLQ